jgi:transcriptional regulator with GAF, ATPase, and Fis domain
MQNADLAAAALLDVSLRLAATRSLDELLPVVLERLVELLGAERALFAHVDDDGGIEDALVHNLAWTRGEALPISNRVVAEVLRSKEMRLVVNTDLDRELNAYESIKQHGLRFILAVPVVACGRVAGVLYADSRAPVLAETVRRGEASPSRTSSSSKSSAFVPCSSASWCTTSRAPCWRCCSARRCCAG